jgi:hypothetical protein
MVCSLVFTVIDTGSSCFPGFDPVAPEKTLAPIKRTTKTCVTNFVVILFLMLPHSYFIFMTNIPKRNALNSCFKVFP